MRHLSLRAGNVARGGAPRAATSHRHQLATRQCYLWRSNVWLFAVSDVGADARAARIRCFGDFNFKVGSQRYFMFDIECWNIVTNTKVTTGFGLNN